MTTRRKAAAELASGEFEIFATENVQSKNLSAGPSKSPRVKPERLGEIKTSLRRETMTDLKKNLAENLKETMTLVAPLAK